MTVSSPLVQKELFLLPAGTETSLVSLTWVRECSQKSYYLKLIKAEL